MRRSGRIFVEKLIVHKKIECLNCNGRIKEKQKAEIVTQLRQKYPLEILLEISKVKRSTYYYNEKKGKVDKYAVEKEEIIELFNYHKQRYGYRRITDEMRAKGYIINHKMVLKLMKSLNLKGKQRKNEKYHSYKDEAGKVPENLL